MVLTAEMNDLDGAAIICSAKSSFDSGFGNGFENGFLSDSSSSDDLPSACSPSCLFEEYSKGRKYSTQSCHHCTLYLYSIPGRSIETMSPKTFLYIAKCVRVLDLSRNNLKTLPDTIGELQNLQELNLSSNKLVSLPVSSKNLQKLQVLNLSQNLLTESPLSLELGMERLTHLDLSRNSISNLPNPPKCLPSLQVLDLSHNCLNLMPLWLLSAQCRSIVELDVSFNFCFDDPSLRSQLPLLKHHRTSCLKSLTTLKIGNTGSNMLIISPLSSFEALQRLHMGNTRGPDLTLNHFSEFPVSLFHNPSMIVELRLPNIGLAGLPEEFYKFKNLQILDASNNPLDWLPEKFGLLKNLQELILSDCNLSYLPEDFGELQSLRNLVLDHNKLTNIQNALSSLLNLECLDVYNNILEELPVSTEHLKTLHKVDIAHNYFNLEVALDIDVNGEKLFDIYCRKQTQLREANGVINSRFNTVKVVSHTPSWDSLESLHKRYDSDSDSEESELDDNTSTVKYFATATEDVEEENWDEDSSNEDDEFDPNSVYRYSLPLGKYHFGWLPPIKRRELPVPVNQQASGFVFIPGQLHQKSTVRRRKVKITDLPVHQGQFDDALVHHIADLQKAESLGALLSKTYMFVRNPGGVRFKRRCRFHSIYEDCLHHGMWYRVCPPINFEIPEEEEVDL